MWTWWTHADMESSISYLFVVILRVRIGFQYRWSFIIRFGIFVFVSLFFLHVLNLSTFYLVIIPRSFQVPFFHFTWYIHLVRLVQFLCLVNWIFSFFSFGNHMIHMCKGVCVRYSFYLNEWKKKQNQPMWKNSFQNELLWIQCIPNSIQLFVRHSTFRL